MRIFEFLLWFYVLICIANFIASLLFNVIANYKVNKIGLSILFDRLQDIIDSMSTEESKQQAQNIAEKKLSEPINNTISYKIILSIVPIIHIITLKSEIDLLFWVVFDI
jgi:hypothetical protein